MKQVSIGHTDQVQADDWPTDDEFKTCQEMCLAEQALTGGYICCRIEYAYEVIRCHAGTVLTEGRDPNLHTQYTLVIARKHILM